MTSGGTSGGDRSVGGADSSLAGMGGAPLECDAGLSACAGTCVDTTTDTANCGHCGTDCGSGALCEKSSCISDDPRLKSLSLDPAALDPAFSADVSSYTAKFAFFEPHLTLKALPAAETAKVAYGADPLATEGSVLSPTPEDDIASVKVNVTAESGKQQSYDVALKRAALVTTYGKAFNSRESFLTGTSVAISGDTAVFGAPGEDSGASGVDGNESSTGYTSAGAAYVALRGANGKWARQAYLKASLTKSQAFFGQVVAIDGNTIAIGAPGQTNYAGAVYVFARVGSTWSQQAVLAEPVPAASRQFGYAIDLKGDRLVVSSISSDLVRYSGGAVYSFTRTGGTWKADAKHPNPPIARFQTYDGFGYRLSLSGERLAVSEQQGERAVFIMLHGANGWTVEDSVTLPSDALANSNIALDGDTLVASAPGVVHVFTRTESTWTKQVSLTSFNADANTGFGSAVALKGDLLVVGSGCDSCSGGVSTFVRSGDTWKSGTFVKWNKLDAGDAVGFSVALSGNRIIAGAPHEDSNATSFYQDTANNSVNDSGAAFIFE